MLFFLLACAQGTESAGSTDTVSVTGDGLQTWTWRVDCSEPATESPPMPTDEPLIAQVVYWQDQDGNGTIDRAVNSSYTLDWSTTEGGGLTSADICTEGTLGGALVVMY